MQGMRLTTLPMFYFVAHLTHSINSFLINKPRFFLHSQSFINSKKFSTSIDNYESYLINVAKTIPPQRLQTLLELLCLDGHTLISPTGRDGMNPFLIPISKYPNSLDNSLLCYIRWPTQKENMDLQLVKTNGVGVKLVSKSTDELCHRYAVEFDYYAHPKHVEAANLLNKHGQLYNVGDYLPFFKSGKFPSLTEKDIRLILDRYLLTKVGAFPDAYERLANNFFDAGNEVSALVTCERATSLFYGWGHPIAFHAMMLMKFNGRDKEARDSARAAMGMPKWTLADNRNDLESIAKLAGFTDSKIVGDMHKFRSTDPRTGEVEEGLSPIQLSLDQAAHLMDAVALDCVEGGWSTALRNEIADKYAAGGYPQLVPFIKS